jgi:hypothetical protein
MPQRHHGMDQAGAARRQIAGCQRHQHDESRGDPQRRRIDRLDFEQQPPANAWRRGRGRLPGRPRSRPSADTAATPHAGWIHWERRAPYEFRSLKCGAIPSRKSHHASRASRRAPPSPHDGHHGMEAWLVERLPEARAEGAEAPQRHVGGGLRKAAEFRDDGFGRSDGASRDRKESKIIAVPFSAACSWNEARLYGMVTSSRTSRW